MIAEYALAYGGPPDPSMPWPMFALLVSRSNRLFARSLLATIDGTGHAIAKTFGSDKGGSLDSERRDVERVAFPWQKSKGPVFALKQSKDDDDG